MDHRRLHTSVLRNSSLTDVSVQVVPWISNTHENAKSEPDKTLLLGTNSTHVQDFIAHRRLSTGKVLSWISLNQKISSLSFKNDDNSAWIVNNKKLVISEFSLAVTPTIDDRGEHIQGRHFC